MAQAELRSNWHSAMESSCRVSQTCRLRKVDSGLENFSWGPNPEFYDHTRQHYCTQEIMTESTILTGSWVGLPSSLIILYVTISKWRTKSTKTNYTKSWFLERKFRKNLTVSHIFLSLAPDMNVLSAACVFSYLFFIFPSCLKLPTCIICVRV